LTLVASKRSQFADRQYPKISIVLQQRVDPHQKSKQLRFYPENWLNRRHTSQAAGRRAKPEKYDTAVSRSL
jgi:hypothetical protein